MTEPKSAGHVQLINEPPLTDGKISQEEFPGFTCSLINPSLPPTKKKGPRREITADCSGDDRPQYLHASVSKAEEPEQSV